MSWADDSQITGFYLNKTWHNLNCKNTITFQSHSYQTCLKNKTLVLLGDSTTRQYLVYFVTEVLKFPKIDLKKYSVHHSPIEFKNFGIHIIHKIHEMPFYSAGFPATGITSEATEINTLAKSDIPGKDIVIVAHYCVHLHSLSSELFRFKIRRLADSIKNLLEVKPDANVFIKGPHVFFLNRKWFDVRISFNQKNIIFEEFEDLRTKVIYLDVWSITAAHNIVRNCILTIHHLPVRYNTLCRICARISITFVPYHARIPAPPPPPPPTHTPLGKSQVAIGFLRNSCTDPPREAI